MNKFAIIALFACVAMVGAQPVDLDIEASQGAVMCTDEEETAFLKPDQEAYADFCIESRDHILDTIKKGSDDISSKLFNVIFFKAGDIGASTLDVVKSGAARLTKTLRNPNSQIEPLSDDSDESERIIYESQKRIAEGQVQPAAFLDAFKSTLGAASAKLSKSISAGLDSLKSKFGLEELGAHLTAACQTLDGLDSQIKSSFLTYQSEHQLSGPSYDKLKCVTARRVSFIDGICKVIQAVRPYTGKFTGK